jgi:hypothetical protein
MSSVYLAKLRVGDPAVLSRRQASEELGEGEEDGAFDVAAEVFGDLAGNLSPARSLGSGARESLSSRSGGGKGHPDLEGRSQKTAAAVDQMRDRLHAMGILQSAVGSGPSASAGAGPVAASSGDLPDPPPASPVRNINARSTKPAAVSPALTQSEEGVGGDEEVPPPYSASSGGDRADSEQQRQKTAAAVDEMRDSLSRMGILVEPDVEAAVEAAVEADVDDDATESTISGGGSQGGGSQGEGSDSDMDDDTELALADKAKRCSDLLM